MKSSGKILYRPINPGWFYSYLNLPNLEIKQQELIELHQRSIKDQVKFTEFYSNVYAPNIVGCPSLMEYFRSLNLEKKLVRILFSISSKSDFNKIGPHVDSVNPLVGWRYSLNIPLIDAYDSWIVWYQLKQGKQILFDHITSTGWLDDRSNIQEVQRAQYICPMLINTSILHLGEITSPKRLIAGLRFWPELTFEEIARLGISVPLVQQEH